MTLPLMEVRIEMYTLFNDTYHCVEWISWYYHEISATSFLITTQFKLNAVLIENLRRQSN